MPNPNHAGLRNRVICACSTHAGGTESGDTRGDGSEANLSVVRPKSQQSGPVRHVATPCAPRGLCECGCGKPTKIARWSDASQGLVKGQPKRFVLGHGHVVAARNRTRWVEVDGPLDTGCWHWTGTVSSGGYGSRARGDGTPGSVLAHRFAYEQEHGPIPDGHQIHHVCGVRTCVRVSHLELVTPAEHAQRHPRPKTAKPKPIWTGGSNGGRPPQTHCVRGHEMSEDNVLRSSGRRWCKACVYARRRAKKETTA